MKIRSVFSSDYYTISSLLNDWWDGRQMSNMLPKLFFDHFNDTSFVAEQDGVIIGFLNGFLSQSRSDEAYIHFVGVHPDYRKQDVGTQLYNQFFNVIKQNGRSVVRCVTSPVNKGSVVYHTKMGFEIEKGDREDSGILVFSDYDGKGGDRVLFVKKLT
ncbi:GNAT family N-acetyltransferase [Alkalihalobacillus sp. AL-G]|uniref:GNAT family N-acetyltransferase n=1 Tax=Alkalihalobacillus sp. AL-G TaxID=2926399 RepID=UPI00272D3DB6|nr:GNAT family N-acetyltransferase [Alkalihalobacillus sp. AL-G]WLD92545.1 GNAT family N-acetyltransferase [Alkalihalobacillus sp. AL-G]